jgi:hypothetical protein
MLCTVYTENEFAQVYVCRYADAHALRDVGMGRVAKGGSVMVFGHTTICLGSALFIYQLGGISPIWALKYRLSECNEFGHLIG